MKSHSELPVLAYFDDDLVDELWAFMKEEGITQEVKNEVEAKLASKFKFGLGNLVTALFTDLSTELDTSLTAKRSTVLRVLPVLRLVMLQDLISPTTDLENLSTDDPNFPRIGRFVKLSLPNLLLLPVPTLGDLIAGLAVDASEQKSAKRAHRQPPPIGNMDRVMPFLMAESSALLPEGGLVGLLLDTFAAEFQNVFSLNRNDLTLGLSRITEAPPDVFVVTMCKESKIRRTTAVHAGAQTSVVFGRCVEYKVKGELTQWGADDRATLIAVEPIAITLAR